MTRHSCGLKEGVIVLLQKRTILVTTLQSLPFDAVIDRLLERRRLTLAQVAQAHAEALLTGRELARVLLDEAGLAREFVLEAVEESYSEADSYVSHCITTVIPPEVLFRHGVVLLAETSGTLYFGGQASLAKLLPDVQRYTDGREVCVLALSAKRLAQLEQAGWAGVGAEVEGVRVH